MVPLLVVVEVQPASEVGVPIRRDYVNGERGVPGKALNPSSTSYPDHGRCGNLPLQGKITTAETEIEPGTSWLVVRSSDRQATRLVSFTFLTRDMESKY
jgi:hypothetical protein